MNVIIRILIFAVLIHYAPWSALAPRLALAQPADAKQEGVAALPAVSGDQLVSIDFNDVDIVVFIKFISDLTKKNFIIDEKVRGKVTIISPGKITVAEAYQVFLSVLEVHDYTIVPAGKITKIVPSPDARSQSIKTRLEEEAMGPEDNVVTQIVPLRYADPNEIKQLFTPLVSKSSVILSYTPTNTLIITDVQSNIKRLLRILSAIDITGIGQQIAIIPVEYADASKLVSLLGSIFNKSAGRGKGAATKDITFVADERTNSIVLLASEGDTDNIRKLIRSLDKETPRGQAKIHVYYLEHASAEDLAKVLQDIPQKSTDSGNTAGKKTAPVVSDKVRISADKATNSLIIMAEMEDYVVLESIIKKIDIPRAMVYIEALIMEVNVEKDFRLGTEWLVGGEATYNDKDGVYGGGFSAGGFSGDAGTLGTATGNLLPPGFSLGVFGENITIGSADDGTLITFPTIAAIVQAYKKDSDVQILSTPQILTTDNQEAKISVGSNVPFQTTATATSSGNEVYNSFEYRDVGKTLKITPQISKDRMVRLQLSLEVSDLQNSTDFRPTTLKRTIETTAIVKDGNTVVLGGLIDNSISNTDYRVPCLGDIPVLGYLFRSSARGNEKTNLYVFLTPRVIQNPSEATKVSAEKRRDIDRLREENIKLFHKNPVSPETLPATPGVESYHYKEEVEPPPPAVKGEAVPQEPLEEKTAATSDMISTTVPAAEGANVDAASPPDHQNNTIVNPAAADPTPSVEESTLEAHTVEPQAQVALDLVGDQSTEKMAPMPSPVKSIKASKYTVQVASVQSVGQADRVLKQLIGRGYAAYTVQTKVENKTWYRLRIGYFNVPEETRELMDRLRTDHFDPILIKF